MFQFSVEYEYGCNRHEIPDIADITQVGREGLLAEGVGASVSVTQSQIVCALDAMGVGVVKEWVEPRTGYVVDAMVAVHVGGGEGCLA